MDYQLVKLRVYSILFHLGDGDLMMKVSFAFALIYMQAIANGFKDRIKLFLVVGVTGLTAFIGARVLHVLLERPELLSAPERIFSRFDGMTFNGALLFGCFSLFLGLRSFPPEQRKDYWDRAAIVTAFSYGLMRIGCFAKGCCWGKVAAVPWSVKYAQSLVMPWIGIPVHPVQLYDASLGFFVGFILICVKKKRLYSGKSIEIFLFLYSIGRFGTEFFRGDRIRGENLFLSLSTSQLVSLVMLFLLFAKWSLGIRRATLLGGLAMIATGCLPSPPRDSEFLNVRKTEFLESRQTKRALKLKPRNVLFIAADDVIQRGFAPMIQALYPGGSPPRLEDIAFWEYAKDLKAAYNVIVRIPPLQVGYAALSDGLSYMESLRVPYDLILLTHGVPNYLSTGQGYFFSYREIGELKGRLPFLNAVMLQSCYGQSLVRDFKEAGAKRVMSYSGLNRNFFFYGVFLKYYARTQDVEEAFNLAKKNFSSLIQGTFNYKLTVQALLYKENQTLAREGKPALTEDDLIAQMPAPALD